MNLTTLLDRLRQLDGKGYRAYKQVRGRYSGPHLDLFIDHVQGDPFADPSRFRTLLPPGSARLPEWAFPTRDRRRATADFLNRRLVEAFDRAGGGAGSGKSGELRVLRPGQQVLHRTSTLVGEKGEVEARFRVGLPARGRTILGRAAADLVARAVDALDGTLRWEAIDEAALRRHVECVEDAVALRRQLRERKLVAFVADGAVLPRRSGIDDRPLQEGVVPFEAPDSLRVTLRAPNAGELTGMGVPEGITLVVGGGYHGKSTLLHALERGIYDHVPGDGRERVVAVSDAVKVRAEDGRRVAGTDISNFIGRLPNGADTRAFATENASGSTSQAAAIVEALELGARCLLLDEDTSATNFMIRDARMQTLVASEHEPITPFIDRVRALHAEHGVSTVVVVGGSGDYFDVADTVIAMKDYRPEEVTERARAVAADLPTHRATEGGPWSGIRRRRVDAASLDPSRGRRDVSVRVRSVDRLEFGRHRVDLASLEQVVEAAQTRAMAHALVLAREQVFPGAPDLREALDRVRRRIQEEGLEVVHPEKIGELADFRIHELGAFLNRIRSLRVEPVEEEDAAGSPPAAAESPASPASTAPAAGGHTG